MQIRIITLHDTSSLVDDMKVMFPNADVGIQVGIDLRKSSSDVLNATELITHGVVHTLHNGRRWHHEVGAKGAVGLAHANRLALEEDLTQPLLLLEDDCVIVDPERFKREVSRLLLYTDRFDLAAFGAYYHGRKGGSRILVPPWLPDGFEVITDTFWFLQCVLYTPMGRERVARLLYRPLDMQIDSLYGMEAKMGRLTVVGQTKNWSANQRYHPSSVQSSFGLLQDQARRVGMLLVIAALVGYCCWCKCKASRKRDDF